MLQQKRVRLFVYLCTCVFIFIRNTIEGNQVHDVCNGRFRADLLLMLYDKYNGETLENDKNKSEQSLVSNGEGNEEKDFMESGKQRSKNSCNDLNCFNAVRTFWNLKIKALCTETTSILDKLLLNRICSKKYVIPHIVIEGVKINNTLVNLDFVCAHFLYNNDREIIKCIKKNTLRNYLDKYHIAFDLYVSKNALKLFSKVDNELNLKELKLLSLNKNIIDNSLCRIHSDVYNVMNEEEYTLLKVLMGLCTKLGFHTQFLMTDNIHPLFNPISKKLPFNFNSLHLQLKNTSMYFTNYDYFLYSLKFTEFDYTINTSMSPVVLRLSNNNSFISWSGFTRDDNNLYERKFDELYERLKQVDYLERINFCYNKYTFHFYEVNKNYFQKYLSEEEKQMAKAKENIYIYLISSVCKNILNVHHCVQKIVSLDGKYDNFFKNFMINFIYYNTSCAFKCNYVDAGRIFNDDHLWKLFVQYFTHAYLVRYKKKKDNVDSAHAKYNEFASTAYDELLKSYYRNYDYKYIHSGKWRKEMENINEQQIMKSSNNNIEYEFYNYAFHLIDLNTYSFFILKNDVQEDDICKIASFVQENGKKYIHVNKSIEKFFTNSGRFLSDEGKEKHEKEETDEKGVNEEKDKWDGNRTKEDASSGKKENGVFNLFDMFSDDLEEGKLSNMIMNNDFLNNGKLLDFVMQHANGEEDLHGDDDVGGSFDDFEDYDDFKGKTDGEAEFDQTEVDKNFDIENFKLETKEGVVYPLEKQYDYKQLLAVNEMHPTFEKSDSILRKKFFQQSKYVDSLFFQINGFPTKIPNFYKHYYDIKKKMKTLTIYEDRHYKMLLKKEKEKPNAFSIMNTSFECSINGKWPIRNTSGNWVSDILCEAYFVPQMLINYEKREKEEKQKNKKKHKKNHTNNKKESKEDEKEKKKEEKEEEEEEEKEHDTSYQHDYIIKENTRLIGIEFEDQEPYRCVISYLGDETNKRILPISAAHILQAAIGFCILHGFKIIWLADSAFDPHTDIYLKFTSVLEKGKTYYELHNFQLYGQTRLVPQTEYIASGININTDIITSAVFKNRYSVIGFPGTDLQFLILMSKKVQNMVYNLKFDCYHWAYEGCAAYYHLMKTVHTHPSDKVFDHIILPNNTHITETKKKEMYKCAFMHDPTFIELNKLFPKECTFGSRIGDCHSAVRKKIPCYNKKSCKHQIYIYEHFYRPTNYLNLLQEHFINVSETLSKLAKPYYIQSIISLEEDTQKKKYDGKNTEYEDIMLFMLKNAVFYISWVTSSEFWKRAIYVQSSNINKHNQMDMSKSELFHMDESEKGTHSTALKKELFCPIAYAHEFIKHMFTQYMKFPVMQEK